MFFFFSFSFFHFPPLLRQLFTQGPLPDGGINWRVDPTFQRLGVQQRQVWDMSVVSRGLRCSANPVAFSNGLASFFWLFDFHSPTPDFLPPAPFLQDSSMAFGHGCLMAERHSSKYWSPLLLSVCLEGCIAPGEEFWSLES